MLGQICKISIKVKYPVITLTILLYNSRMQLQNNMYMIQSTIGSFPCLLIQSLKAVTRV